MMLFSAGMFPEPFIISCQEQVCFLIKNTNMAAPGSNVIFFGSRTVALHFKASLVVVTRTLHAMVFMIYAAALLFFYFFMFCFSVLFTC